MNASAPLTPYAIARLWSTALASDRIVNDWAKETFGKIVAIRIGADMRRPPNEQDAPFVSIFPDSGKTGPQRQAIISELGIVAGIVDDEWTDRAGVVEMRALYRLNQLCPMLENAMRMALPKARLQSINIEFEILQFPLCMALMAITVEESVPIGRR